MTFKRILAIIFIFCASAVGWFILGGAVTVRTGETGSKLQGAVTDGWGPPLAQPHPEAWYLTPGSARPEVRMLPTASNVRVRLAYEPRKRGLLWYRTYAVHFEADYEIANPSPVTQTVYAKFALPAAGATYHNFAFKFGDGDGGGRTPTDGALVEATQIPAGGTAKLKVSYETRGSDAWRYAFPENARIKNFALSMETDFAEIDFPAGTASPTSSERAGDGWNLAWDYPDVLSAKGVGMGMPSVINAGPVAARVAFFAPVGLLFFFAVIWIVCSTRGEDLHPMNYFFVAAGFFAFQLLFAYLVDVLPLAAAFACAAAVSLALVCGYLHAVARGRITKPAIAAQLAFMVLFSYSFFFEGYTGLTITIAAVITLALLMRATARINWASKFAGVPPLPKAAA